MRIAYISGVCVQYDAISDAVVEGVRNLLDDGAEVVLYTYQCDYEDIPSRIVSEVGDIVGDPFFQSADVVILHYGIFYPLFYALLAAPVDARVLVTFHNITPKELLPSWDRRLIEQSFEQLSLLSFADHVLCDSETNRSVLRSAGIATPATVRSLGVDLSEAPSEKPSFSDGVLRVAYVGRFVRSKGPQDLIAALDRGMPNILHDRVSVQMVGNLGFSDSGLFSELVASARDAELAHSGRLRIEIRGNVENAEKNRILADADLFVLPTYHEGFCVPILEALAAGCRVITYENSNTPAISGGFADLIPTGDVVALAEANEKGARLVGDAAWVSDGYRRYITNTREYVSFFSRARVKSRFLDIVGKFGRSETLKDDSFVPHLNAATDLSTGVPAPTAA
ncbi:glycosyltransferase family 4 protein [Diaminobutyricimonas sp. TR449]|uniref:glycosyltransferase family 4 protein n=1 Tax=Diaminobutyricimonas sp. TR449 TaxID=2708076 RepID=UPI00141F8D97|nr:glycosyltransferase family 4 protein [Diaminobutyricimonas sp. TR449]